MILRQNLSALKVIMGVKDPGGFDRVVNATLRAMNAR